MLSNNCKSNEQTIASLEESEVANTRRLSVLTPTVYIDKALSESQAVVAAAHAGLAWHLKFQSTASYLELIPFRPNNFELVSQDQLDLISKESSTFISMTESSLGGARTCLVCIPGQNPARIERDLTRRPQIQIDAAIHLKMYILIKNYVSGKDALSASANAAVATFLDYQNNHLMQNWIAGRFYKTICRVGDAEFLRALDEPSHTLIKKPGTDEIVAVGFCPRTVWPSRFKFFKLYR